MNNSFASPICSNEFCYQIFNASTNWTVPQGVNEVDVLVVGGGGAGGSSLSFSFAGAGGGGSGGLIYEQNFSVIPLNNISITVGEGGAPALAGNTPGGSGQNSVFANLTAIGGGGGSGRNMQGLSGGSGGGSRGNPGGIALQPTSTSGGDGNRGGNCPSSPSRAPASGGGGAGSAGQDISCAADTDGGNGGDGLLINITGTPTWYAGGGGGGASRNDGLPGFGGSGIGGNGGNDNIIPQAGIDGTGSGGGGGNNNRIGASGGSGIVIVRFIDNIIPSIEINNPIDNSNYDSSTHLINISASDNVELDTIWYNWNGTNVTYTNPINITFSDGTYTLQAWTNDTAGNINTTSVTFTVDTIVPNIEIITPGNVYYNQSQILLNISATDINLAYIWYNWNGTNITYTNPVNITLPDGIYTMQAWANDTARNTNTTSVTFTVDTIAPDITIISPENITHETLTVLLNITAQDTNLQTIWYNWNGTNITYTNPINITYPAAGIYTIFAWANDSAGNINSTNISFEVTDNPIKNITLIAPQNNEKILATEQIELIWNITNIFDETMNCQIFVNSINIANQSCERNINNSFILNVSRGYYNWSINASNSAGYYLESETQNFTIIEQNHVRVTKSIRSENTDAFVIRTNIENLVNRTSQVNIFEFVPSTMNAGSFTPTFDFMNITSGINYIGNIYIWDLNVLGLSQNQLNYSITKNTDYWKVSRNYIIGFE